MSWKQLVSFVCLMHFQIKKVGVWIDRESNDNQRFESGQAEENSHSLPIENFKNDSYSFT